MGRPTRDQLIHAQGLLEELATRHDSYDNPNGFPDVVTLLDLLVWRSVEQDHAQHAAVYGPGGERSPEGGGTISRGIPGRSGFGRPTENRLFWGTDKHPRDRPELNDPLYRALRELRAAWNTELGQMVDRWRQQATNAARFPTRTQETG